MSIPTINRSRASCTVTRFTSACLAKCSHNDSSIPITSYATGPIDPPSNVSATMIRSRTSSDRDRHRPRDRLTRTIPRTAPGAGPVRRSPGTPPRLPAPCLSRYLHRPTAPRDLSAVYGTRPPAVFLQLSLIHISEPTRPLYISYAVFCLKKKNKPHIMPP